MFLDGTQVCYAPCVLQQVAPGLHRIEGRLDGFRTTPLRVMVTAGQSTHVVLEMKRR